MIPKRGKRLDEEDRETLTALMEKNERLYQAYLMKEEALDIFEERDEQTALKRLHRWFDTVRDARMTPFDAMVKTVKSYRYGVANYLDIVIL